MTISMLRIGALLLMGSLATLLSAPAAQAGLLDGLVGDTPAAADEFLPPEQAFGLEVEPTAGGLKAHFRVTPGYYLYKDRLKVTPQAGSAAIGVPEIPAGKDKEDPEFGVIQAMTDDFDVEVPIAAAGDEPVRVIVAYQGCAEAGLCYPPIKKEFEFLPTAFTGAGALSATDTDAASAGRPAREARAAPSVAGGAAASAAAGEGRDEAGALADRLAGASVASTLLLFLGLGLLLALTPCVFPMVPILSGILVGQGEALTARRGFMVSLAYVLAMAGTYAVAGVVTASLGSSVQAALQHPAVLVTFAGVFVVLSFSMFGFYELQLPSSLQTRLAAVGGEPGRGGIMGAAVMGSLSALIVGPCVAPPLLGALLYIATTGDAVLGGAALFALGFGMGLPLLALGASAGHLLPRAGAWMVAVKHVFGVLMLAVAWWLLERLLPGPVVLAGWALLLIGVAAQLGALEGGAPGDGAGLRLRRGLGLAALIYGGALMLGAAGGADDPLKPLAGFVRGEGPVASGPALAFRTVTTPQQVRAELDSATAAGEPVMLDFYADWCIECKRMERTTFRDPAVLAALAGHRLLKVDVTANDEAQRELLAGYGLYGPPATLFLDATGAELRRLRLTGYADGEAFLAHLAQLRAPGLAAAEVSGAFASDRPLIAGKRNQATP
jgi:thioredoxin:protein disulfide reductase